jgi:hypothetical protein
VIPLKTCTDPNTWRSLISNTLYLKHLEYNHIPGVAVKADHLSFLSVRTLMLAVHVLVQTRLGFIILVTLWTFEHSGGHSFAV